MGAAQSRLSGPRRSRGRNQTLAPHTFDSRLISRDDTQGLTVYNNNANVNYMFGSGTIINNNHVTNFFSAADTPNKEVCHF